MTYHSYRPAVADRILTPEEALSEVAEYVEDESFMVVGIAGSGEPLYNTSTSIDHTLVLQPTLSYSLYTKTTHKTKMFFPYGP